jgi:hypothetical protein
MSVTQTKNQIHALQGGFLSLDPTPWLCSDNCPAIVDGIVAYRDASHISVDMSAALSDNLRDFLRSNGVI